MTLILTIEIHVLQKRAYLTYSAIKVVYTAFTLRPSQENKLRVYTHNIHKTNRSTLSITKQYRCLSHE